MKQVKYVFFFIGLLLLVGCSAQSTTTDDDVLLVQSQTDKQDSFGEFIEITNEKTVQKVKNIVHNIRLRLDHSEIIKQVRMIRLPDFKFHFKQSSEDIYYVCISPKGKKVELIFDGKYVQLDNDTSAELFNGLTGKNLSDVDPTKIGKESPPPLR
ncbi:hypothetical protein [Priestia koreensis]|uniref:hypothetical protein n=1 Tax=Priestia koreensis TaxID=284581 RepID=UPI00203C7FE1|nr:hypothetical protein [Priestia koreensis]MCM3004240.1 hypothetical protein [Priestia koreensis]